MTKHLPLVLLAAALGACAPTGSSAASDSSATGQRSASAAPRFEVPDTLDAFIKREMEQRHIPGLSLAIARAGQVIAARAYGVADVQNQVPVNTGTRFELASLSKAFTAAGIMLLVEDGKLDLDAPISTYLTDAPQHWAGVSTRHLLNHTAGLPGIGQAFRTRTTPWPLDMSTQQMYDAARGDTLSSRPGARFVYSDEGYFLLGMITEKASGMPWRDFVKTRILQPLGMTDSYLMDLDRIHRNEARGYTLNKGELVNIRRVHQIETPSFIGVFSNVTDLVKWDAALYGNRLLREASRAAMWTPLRLTDGSVHTYGFGWNVWCQQGRPVHQHTGLTGTEIVRLPADTLTVIVLTNLGGPSFEVNSWDLAPRVAQMMVPALVSPEKAVPLSDMETARITGTFRYVAGYVPRDPVVRISTDSGKLYLQQSGVRIPLSYAGGDVYHADGEPVVIVTERDSAGRVVAWRVHNPYPAPSTGAVRSMSDCAVGVAGAGPLISRAIRDGAASAHDNAKQ